MLLEFDLAGAEWFVTGFLAPEPAMIEVFRSGKSPHPVTGARMTELSEDLVVADSKLIGLRNDPDEIAALRRENLPEVLKARWLPRTMSIRQAGKKCLAPDTEVLTQAGWIKIEHLKAGTEVAQWENGMISFVKPDGLWVYANKEPLIHLQGNHISQIVTKDHRIPLRDRHGRYSEVIVRSLPREVHYSIPVSGILQNTSVTPTPLEARLLAAVQADGTVTPYGQIVFKLHKARKLWRLKWLLSELGLDIADSLSGIQFHLPRCDLVNNIVHLLCGFSYTRQKRHAVKTPRKGNLPKTFGDYLLRFSPEALSAFVDELRYWDGHSRAGGGKAFQYFTTVRANAEWVQTAAHLTGNRASVRERINGPNRKNLFWVSIGSCNNTNTLSVKRCESGANKVYCLTVSSGFFMVRHNGKISVTGNSNHALNYREEFRTFALKNNMSENEAKTIIELYRGTRLDSSRAAYPGLLKWYERIDRTVRDTRRLYNCFGGSVYFSGALNDDTFRKATAYVPQSTVFFVTAQAMPKLLDDETPDFAPSQLLIQDHDSLVTQYRSRDFAAMARYAIRLGLDYLSPVLRYNGFEFTLSVGCKVGLNWKDMTEIKLTRDEGALAASLEKIWNEQRERIAA